MTPEMNQYVVYYRVSTDKQGKSRLGLEAQEYSAKRLVESNGGEIIARFEEVESGKRNDRPELRKALDLCKEKGVTLLIAKLDRLSRVASMILSLRDSGVNFVCADMPQADRLTIGILACVAEKEAEMISQRTKDGLAAAKRRGVKLGNPNPGSALALARQKRSESISIFNAAVKPAVAEIKLAGVTSFCGVAKCLNARGIKSFYGGRFSAATARRIVLSQKSRE